MTWEDYARLPGDTRYEYVDGKVIATPFPTPRHAVTIQRLMTPLSASLPTSHLAVSHVGWKAGDDEFGPDAMVIPSSVVDETRFDGVPALVVEVVSSNRASDLVVKVGKYAKAGAPRYWIIDLRDRVLLALVLVDGVYRVAAQLDDDNPSAELETGLGTVRVSLPQLFA
jgi:Uma2 family endonuclease